MGEVVLSPWVVLRVSAAPVLSHGSESRTWCLLLQCGHGCALCSVCAQHQVQGRTNPWHEPGDFMLAW